MANDQTYTIARDILDQALSKLSLAGRPAPDRDYVSVGQTAHDCEQITVTLIRIFAGLPASEGIGLEHRRPCAGPRTAEYSLELVRCFPSLQESDTNIAPPTPAAIEAVAIDLHEDAYILMSGLANSTADGLIAGASCDDVALGNTSIEGPTGGVAVVRIGIQVQLS